MMDRRTTSLGRYHAHTRFWRVSCRVWPAPMRRSFESTPYFLITIDTEGDDLWSRPRTITTNNARWLPRFQALCERFGLLPTYLVNWEMATSRAFVDLGREVCARGTGEVGMHLHAWNSPPLVPLTADDFHHQPYLIEYPETVLREKVKVMTDTLETTFGVKMRSHRAGRWAIDSRYTRALAELGYEVDCSVTPNVSWTSSLGAPNGEGGCDYTQAPETPYFFHVDRDGRAPLRLLELPMTVQKKRGHLPKRVAATRAGKWIERRLFPTRWLRPRGNGREDMLAILDDAVWEQRGYVEFMIHSSELMPGGSPTFPTRESIERLYDDLEAVFERASARFRAATLAEYGARISSSR